MIHRRRLKTLVIALLLATLPCVGLASFVREAQPACAMQMHGKGAHGAMTMNMSEHCKAMDHAAKSACQKGGHCAMCDDISTSLAVTATAMGLHRLAASPHFHPTDLLLSHNLASPWRPPRAL